MVKIVKLTIDQAEIQHVFFNRTSAINVIIYLRFVHQLNGGKLTRESVDDVITVMPNHALLQHYPNNNFRLVDHEPMTAGEKQQFDCSLIIINLFFVTTNVFLCIHHHQNR